MRKWEDIVNSGLVPQEYTDYMEKFRRGEPPSVFRDMPEEEADSRGQAINDAINRARGEVGRKGERGGTPEYMRAEWNWSDEQLTKAATFYHATPKHSRPGIELHGLRPTLTTTVGDPHEMKQRYGVFGSPTTQGPRAGYGLDPAHPDSDGIKRADIYEVRLPPQDLRIDPYGVPFSERTIKPHEFERVGHALRRPDSHKEEVHWGKEEDCEHCQ
jgi:hypothetical protein